MANDIFKTISQAAGTSRTRKTEADKWNNAALKNAVVNLITLRDGKRLVSAKQEGGQYRTLNASTTIKTVCVLLKRGVTPEVINHYSVTEGEGALPAISERFDYTQIFESAGGAQKVLGAVAEQEGVSVADLAEVLGVKVTKVTKRAKKDKDEQAA